MASIRAILGRVRATGYSVLCLMVDNALYSRRERVMSSRWLSPTRRYPPDPKYRWSATVDAAFTRVSEPLTLPA